MKQNDPNWTKSPPANAPSKPVQHSVNAITQLTQDSQVEGNDLMEDADFTWFTSSTDRDDVGFRQ